MIWDLSMRGEDEGFTTCRVGGMIHTALWGIREKYFSKKHRGSHLNKRPKINGFLLPLLCCDNKKRGVRNFRCLTVQRISSFQTKDNQVWAFTGLTGFCPQTCWMPETALSLTQPGLEKLDLNKTPLNKCYWRLASSWVAQNIRGKSFLMS